MAMPTPSATAPTTTPAPIPAIQDPTPGASSCSSGSISRNVSCIIHPLSDSGTEVRKRALCQRCSPLMWAPGVNVAHAERRCVVVPARGDRPSTSVVRTAHLPDEHGRWDSAFRNNEMALKRAIDRASVGLHSATVRRSGRRKGSTHEGAPPTGEGPLREAADVSRMSSLETLFRSDAMVAIRPAASNRIRERALFFALWNGGSSPSGLSR